MIVDCELRKEPINASMKQYLILLIEDTRLFQWNCEQLLMRNLQSDQNVLKEKCSYLDPTLPPTNYYGFRRQLLFSRQLNHETTYERSIFLFSYESFYPLCMCQKVHPQAWWGSSNMLKFLKMFQKKFVLPKKEAVYRRTQQKLGS